MDGCGLENGWMWFGEWIDVVWRMDGCGLENGWVNG